MSKNSYAQTRPNLGWSCVERVVSNELSHALEWNAIVTRGELTTTHPLSYTFELSSMQDYPLNLNILLSGGKETNKDGPSNGE